MESQNMKLGTEKVKAIAKDVYRALGSGFSEDVYDKAMQVGLRLAKIHYESQKVIELKYKNHHVGEGYPDLVVRLGREKLIIELKAVGSEMGLAEEQQLRNYLKILNISRGLLKMSRIWASRISFGMGNRHCYQRHSSSRLRNLLSPDSFSLRGRYLLRPESEGEVSIVAEFFQGRSLRCSIFSRSTRLFAGTSAARHPLGVRFGY